MKREPIQEKPSPKQEPAEEEKKADGAAPEGEAPVIKEDDETSIISVMVVGTFKYKPFTSFRYLLFLSRKNILSPGYL